MPKIQNKNLFIISLIAIVNALGYGIVIPVLYSYSIRFGLTDFQNGLLFALFSVCQFLATPVIGRLSDKYGRKPLLVISLAGTALSFFVMALAPSWIFLYLARALDGLTAGNLPVAQAVISDSTNVANRAKGFGIMGAAFGFGFIAGPAISALTVGISPALPFIIAGTVSALAVYLTFIFLPETNLHIGQVQKGKLFDFKKLYHALREPVIGRVFTITLFYSLSFGNFIYVFQPFSLKVLGLSASEISTVFTVFGVVGLVSQIFIVPRASKLLGVSKGFSGSILFVSLALVGMFLSKSLLFFIFFSVIFSLANALAQALTATILSLETDAKSQGSIMGLNFSYMSVGNILGPIMGGSLATLYIPLPFLAGALAVLLCFFLSLKIHKVGLHKESAF